MGCVSLFLDVFSIVCICLHIVCILSASLYVVVSCFFLGHDIRSGNFQKDPLQAIARPLSILAFGMADVSD